MDNGNLSASHLAWCGLVALQNARSDGEVSSPAQENLFLVRWLALAEKQRRFSRELAGDISWLLKEGRSQGVHADLPGKLNYLWRAGSGSLKAQNVARLRRERRCSAASGVCMTGAPFYTRSHVYPPPR